MMLSAIDDLSDAAFWRAWAACALAVVVVHLCTRGWLSRGRGWGS
jgi:hypothetical protein